MIEPLEDRLLLSVITWVNRGQTSDRFAEVFGSSANLARQVVDAVIQSWERVIVDFNYTPIFGAKPSAFELTVSMHATTTGFGASADVTDFWLGKPWKGQVTIGRGNSSLTNNGWFLDPTPNEHSEFNGNIVNAFVGEAHVGSPAAGRSDFYSVTAIEMTHAMGLIHRSQSLYQQSGMLTNTGVADTAHGGGTGFYWVFNGPSIDHLMTSYNSGDGGTDFGPGVHSAGPGGSNQPLSFGGKTYQGADDTGNARYSSGRRYLVPNTMRLILQDAYGYTTANPAQWGTFYSNLDTSTGELLVRGGAGNSADLITISHSGSTLTVSVDVGDDIPATGHLPGAGNLPAFVSTYNLANIFSIRIEAGGGNDTIRIDSFPGGREVTVNGGGGDDILHIGFLPGNLNNVASAITFNGGTGNDSLRLWDDLQSSNRTFTITNNSITRSGFGGVTYSNTQEVILRAGGGNDFFTVSSTASGTNYDIRGGAGDDTISLANASGNLNNIAGAVTFDGGAGSDEVRLWDSSGSTGRTYPITNTSVTRDGFAGINYSNTEGLVLHAAGGHDQFNVFSTGPATSVTINGGAGNDTLNLSGILIIPPLVFFFGDLDNVAGPVTFNGGTGTDAINLFDANGTTGRTYTITNNSVSRGGFGGLTYGTSESITLNAAAGNDIFRVNSTHASAPLTINSGAGNDRLDLSWIPENLGTVASTVTFTSIGDGLLVLGTPAATGTYTPSGATTGSGVVLVNGVPISFTGIETPWNAVRVQNFGTFRFVTPNSQDVIDVATVEGGAVNVVGGTSGGVEMVRLLFRDVTNFILDTGANDGVGGGSHSDTVTISPFGVGAVGLATFRYIGGTGTDTLIVNDGTFTFFNNPVEDTANLRVHVNTDNTGSATVRFTAPISRIGILQFGTGGNVVLPPGPEKVLVLDNIFNATLGRIDLTTNGLIVAPGGGVGNLNPSHQAVASGYNGGAWNGTGVMSSSAAANPGRAVGMALSGEAGINNFMGVPVSTSTLVLRYTFAGDANLDLKVNIADLGILAANWQQEPRYWHQGNFNYDLLVNIADLGILAANWQAGVSAGAFSDTVVTDEDEDDEETDEMIAAVGEATDPVLMRELNSSGKSSSGPSAQAMAASQGRAGGRAR